MGATHELKLEGYIYDSGSGGNTLVCEYHPHGLYPSDGERIMLRVSRGDEADRICLDQGQAQELIRFLTFFDGLIEARKVPHRERKSG